MSRNSENNLFSIIGERLTWDLVLKEPTTQEKFEEILGVYWKTASKIALFMILPQLIFCIYALFNEVESNRLYCIVSFAQIIYQIMVCVAANYLHRNKAFIFSFIMFCLVCSVGAYFMWQLNVNEVDDFDGALFDDTNGNSTAMYTISIGMFSLFFVT